MTGNQLQDGTYKMNALFKVFGFSVTDRERSRHSSAILFLTVKKTLEGRRSSGMVQEEDKLDFWRLSVKLIKLPQRNSRGNKRNNESR